MPVFADEEETHDLSFGTYPPPWFTGPLIAPSGRTVKPGDFTLQPFFDAFVNVGSYDSNGAAIASPNFYDGNLRVRFKAGVTSWLDAQITPQISFKETKGERSFGFSDLPLAFNIQLISSPFASPWPSLKMILRTTIPAGKYEKLNPERLGTDGRGTGSWSPEVSFVASKLWRLSTFYYFEARLYTGFQMGTPVSIQGQSVYKGDPTTEGVVYPGNLFFADLAFECTLSQNWAFACDLYYQHRNRSRFSGKTTSSVGLPSSEQFSLAPALEYNWSENLGVIGGIWFSAMGRNHPQFINGIFSINAYF